MEIIEEAASAARPGQAALRRNLAQDAKRRSASEQVDRVIRDLRLGAKLAAGLLATGLAWAYCVHAMGFGSDLRTLKHLAASPGCEVARSLGAAPARKGQVGYWRHLDRNGDGVSCEGWHYSRAR